MIGGMDIVVAQIANNCFRLASSDGAWQAIGFNRRPRHGLIWRLTTPAWKIALEGRIHREFLLVISAAHLVAFDSKSEILHQLVNFYWGDDGGRFGRLFNFPSKASCGRAIDDYAKTPFASWSNLLLDHLEVLAVPDAKLRARLLLGCVEFAMNAPMIRLRIKSCGVDMSHWSKGFNQATPITSNGDR